MPPHQRPTRAPRQAGRALMIVLNSALTDFAAILADPRWDGATAEAVVGGVVVMSGVAESETGV